MKNYDLVVTRTFDAPKEMVFKAWTDPKQVAAWWGPHGFTNPVCKLDMRAGGEIHIDMKGPDGVVYPMGGEVLEVTPHTRYVFTASALDANGKAMFVNHNTVTFEGATTVRVEVKVSSQQEGADQYLKGMEAGWSQSLEKLAAFIAEAVRSQRA